VKTDFNLRVTIKVKVRLSVRVRAMVGAGVSPEGDSQLIPSKLVRFRLGLVL